MLETPSLNQNANNGQLPEELELTEESFCVLAKQGFKRNTLGPEAAQIYVDFDNTQYDSKSHTPLDHRPPEFNSDEVRIAMSDPNQIFEGVYDGDKLIATMWLKVDHDGILDERVIKVANLVVHGDYRRRGIATYFLNAAEIIGRERGAKYSTLDVDPLNEAGINGYTNFGYTSFCYKVNDPEGLNHWVGLKKGLHGESVTSYDQTVMVECDDASGLQGYIESGFEIYGTQKNDARVKPRDYHLLLGINVDPSTDTSRGIGGVMVRA